MPAGRPFAPERAAAGEEALVELEVLVGADALEGADLAAGVDDDDLVRAVDEGHLHRALGHLVDAEEVDPATTGHAAVVLSAAPPALAAMAPAAHFASSSSRRRSRADSSGTRATTGSRKPSTMNLRASSGGMPRLSR